MSTKEKTNCMSPRVKRPKKNNVVATESWSVESTEQENSDSVNNHQEVPINLINNKLSADILAQILTYIPFIERLEMEKVCQKWAEATKLSWRRSRKIVIKNFFARNDGRGKKIFKLCCPFLTHVTVMTYNIPPWLYDIIQNECRNLTHFHIKLLDFLDRRDGYKKAIQVIASISKLENLKVDMSMMAVDQPGDILSQIFDRLPDHIKEIHVTTHAFQEPTLNLDLPARFNNLRGLTFRKFRLTEGTIQSILLNQKSLVHLDLSNCRFPDGASSIFLNLNNIEHLNLHMVKNLTIDTISRIAHNCPKLRYFEFAIISSHNDYQMIIIPFRIFYPLKYLVNLEHLKISSDITKRAAYTESLLSNTENNWKNLRYLNICGITPFSRSDIKVMTNFKKLEYIKAPYATINSKSLIDIASNCLKLKILDVSFRNISEEAIGKLSNLKNLKKLEFNSADGLTDNSLIEIASNCMNLVELTIFSCKNVTEASLFEISKLKHLKKVDIDYAENGDFRVRGSLSLL